MSSLAELLKIAQQDKKILSREEEVKLGTIIQSPTSTEISRQKSIENLVLKNIFLVLKICHRYKRKEFELEDLVGYGILGLFTAARKFDPLRGIRFASYARHWIKDAIMKAIREYSGMPKIPVYLVKNLWKVTRILSKNPEMSDGALAQRADILEKDAIYLRSLMFKAVQFDASYMENSSTPIPEDVYALKERDELICTVLHKILTKNEFIVLAYTHGLYNYPKKPLTWIKYELGIKNPRRLRGNAIEKLRNNSVMAELFKEGL